MNHVRNIKETLNISNENRNAATSSYSSWTDSQLFFGSQLWYENSQGTSQDMSLSSKNSQQSAQEGSDPKLLNNYLSKPLLFGDSGDKIKTSGLLQKFEEDRKKAKERNDSELLARELQRIREKLAAGTETNAAVVQTVLEKIDKFSSTLQNSLRNLQDDMSQKFETLVDKINSHKELMAELEERVQKNGDTTAEFNSHLKHLSDLLSEHSSKRNTVRVMESAIQTSPEFKQPESSFQQSSKPETQVTHASPNPEQQDEGLPENQVFSKKRVSLRRYKKRPLVLPKTRKSRVSDKESQPETHGSELQTLSTPLRERCNQNKKTKKFSRNLVSVTSPNIGSRSVVASGRFITPLNFWSQDSSSPECVTLVEPILEKLTAEPKPPVKPCGLWQLFDSDFVF